MTLRIVQTEAILFLKSISERGGSDIGRLWNLISRSKLIEDGVIYIQSRSMSDPPLSDIDIKHKMAWVWTTLKNCEIKMTYEIVSVTLMLVTNYVSDFMMVNVSRCVAFFMLMTFQMMSIVIENGSPFESVNHTSDLSPTNFVSNIRHQCRRYPFFTWMFFPVYYPVFILL